jgi:hypothetical protein
MTIIEHAGGIPVTGERDYCQMAVESIDLSWISKSIGLAPASGAWLDVMRRAWPVLERAVIGFRDFTDSAT